ncbi:MAG TPA: nucleotidyltransferase, partial [Thermoleophilia bacterium]|nr:nucleotidyltransferase [Thermoleophilia bacterium]
LKLDPDERDEAIAAHLQLRDVLADADVASTAILQGSFARKTMLPPLKDIDLVAFLNSIHEHLKDAPGGSDSAMDLIEKAIIDEYDNPTFDRSAHALRVDLGSGFTFDVVPGFDTDTDLIWIADRDDDRFELSDTRRVTAAVQQRNQDCNGLFVHQIRMIKQWMRHTLSDDIPGFVGECIAYAVITKALSHARACTRVFSEGADLVANGDVAVPESDENVLDRLTEGQITALHDALIDARDRALEAAGLAGAGDDAGAIDLWHQVFGDPFPEAQKQTVEETFSKLVGIGGGVTSTLRGTTAASRHNQTPSTRAWAP